MFRLFLKKLIKKLPFRFTKNQRYDAWTKKIIRRHCKNNSNCVDVGTHKGEILDLILKQCPAGTHYGFEPVPSLFSELKTKYASLPNCRIFDLALSDKKGISSFNYVVSNPAYSGVKKRRYDRPNESDTTIEVHTDLLDNLIPAGQAVDFIKIDVEGGEMDVLKGAQKIISRSGPLIIFEFGIGGSDVYGTTPEELFSFFFFSSRRYSVFLLDDFLKKRPALTAEEFHSQFHQRKNYYFLAAQEL